MRNTKAKRERFERNFKHISPEDSGPHVIEAHGILKQSSLARNNYFFLHVERCPLCNKKHSYQHVKKEDFELEGVLNLFQFEDTRPAKCYNEDVFTKEQINAGYRVPHVHITVDLTTEDHKTIIKDIFKR